MIAVGAEVGVEILVNLIRALGIRYEQIGIIRVQTFLQTAGNGVERAVKSAGVRKLKRAAPVCEDDIVLL